MVQSPIRAMTRSCIAVGGINLGQGVCALPPPEAIVEAAVEAVRSGMAASMYAKFEGIDELRREIVRKMARHNGLPGVDPDREVVVTLGVSGAFAAACLALFDPGDEVILFEPYYGYHVNTLKLAGLGAKLVKLEPPKWALDPAAVAAAVTPRTRAILINTPGNPTGKVWTADEIAAVGAVAERHDLLLLTDEIYEYIAFAGKHVSPATVGRLRERTVTLCGLSKTFSITGWRLGYAVAPEAYAKPMGLVNDLLCVCAPTPLQVAAAKVMATLGDDYYDGLREKYRKKRDRICGALRAAGFTPHDPDGAYYVLAGFEALGWKGADEAAAELLRRTKVAAIPGHAFTSGPEGQRLLRFCFALEDGLLEEACRRIEGLRG